MLFTSACLSYISFYLRPQQKTLKRLHLKRERFFKQQVAESKSDQNWNAPYLYFDLVQDAAANILSLTASSREKI